MKKLCSLFTLYWLIFPGIVFCTGRILFGPENERVPQNSQPKISNPKVGVLPKPTGANPVGTSIYHLVDSSRPDLITKHLKRFREIMLQVWYPTNSSFKGNSASYLPDPALLQPLLKAEYNLQDKAVIENLKNVQTSAILNAPLLGKRSKYPVVFLSHGLGEPRSNYTTLSQDLASYGYIVVSIDHPYGGFTVLPDGRILTTDLDPNAGTPEGGVKLTEEWAQDASFVLNQLIYPDQNIPTIIKQIAEKIDVEKVGMLGHSLGGSAALEACRIDPRFKACANLDGAPFGKVGKEGVKRPTLILRSSPIYSDEDLKNRGRTREQWEEMGRKVKIKWDSIFPKSKAIPFYSIKITGTGHMSFSDAAFTMPDTILRFGGKIIDAQRGFVIISNYVRDFFDKYLKSERKTILDATEPPYEEVLIEKINAQ